MSNRLSWSWLLVMALFILAPSSSVAQKKPSAPTPIDVRERTVTDLLYFPYACLPADVDNEEKAKEALNEQFGSFEMVNLNPGEHQGGSYDFTYRNVPIGMCYVSWYDNQSFYNFYLDTKAEADRFYANLVKDIKKAGIPLVPDKIYGGVSNRRHPVSIFRWVYVNPPVKLTKPADSNLYKDDAIGKYLVELGVYKRAKK